MGRLLSTVCRFDAQTGDVKLHVDVGTNLLQPYCPQVNMSAEALGRF